MLETTDYLIEASQLLVLPEVYVQVKNAIDDPEIGLNQVTKLIGTDACPVSATPVEGGGINKQGREFPLSHTIGILALKIE